MRVIFFGTPLFAASVLDYLVQNKVNIVAVISKPDRPKGRSGTPFPTPVKSLALSYNISVHQPEIVSSLEFAPVLQDYDADLFVVVAYGEIIKQHLLNMPRRACINLHASLLPKYRGAAPIQRCIIEGETETGVTIIHMVKKMDAGDMIKKVVVPIGKETTFGELEQALCQVGRETLLEVITEFEKGNPVKEPQDHTKATLAPKIELEDCQIYWSRPAQELHNLVRGVNPYPGAWCYVNVQGEKKRLKIWKTQVLPEEDKWETGRILKTRSPQNNLLITTSDQLLELIEVQLEGKKHMSSAELIRGMPSLLFSELN